MKMRSGRWSPQSFPGTDCRDVYFTVSGVTLNVYRTDRGPWIAGFIDGCCVTPNLGDTIVKESMAAFRHAVAEARAKRWVGVEL